MRQTPDSNRRSYSAVSILLATTLSIFVIQQLINVIFPGPAFTRGENQFLGEWFALSGSNFKELKVWSIFSYGFLHSTQGFMHILGNMLGLFFIGRGLEEILGKQKLFMLYFAGILLGGCVYLIFHFNNAYPVVGASAAVLALLSFFCLLRPEQPITLLLFFVLPVTVKPKWVFWTALGISVFGVFFDELPKLANPQNGQMLVAHSAHLGGIIAGILFYKYLNKINSLSFFQNSRTTRSQPRVTAEPPAWFKRRTKTFPQKTNYTVNRSSHKELQKEVDRILDKINESGFQSLTPAEKNTLEQAKELLSK